MIYCYAIIDFPVNRHNMIRFYKIAKQQENVPLFEALCNKLIWKCAKTYLDNYTSKADMNNLIAEANVSDFKVLRAKL